MDLKLQNATKRYKHLGIFTLISPGRYAIFGNEDNDDMVFVCKTKLATKVPELFNKQSKLNVSSEECVELWNRIDGLSKSNAYAMFTITNNEIKLIKDAISEIDGTHVRIHAENNKVRFSVFDYRKFIESGRISRNQSQKIVVLDVDGVSNTDFSQTIFATSFNKMKNEDYLIRIGDNSISEFAPMNDEVKYLFRDQEIVEPITTFYSPRLEQDISFVFHPNSLNSTLDTNQSLLP